MNLVAGRAVDIVQVKEQDSYVLRLRLSDGHTSTVDFGPFLRRSQNPQTWESLDRARFRSYEVRSRNLFWGDYDREPCGPDPRHLPVRRPDGIFQC